MVYTETNEVFKLDNCQIVIGDDWIRVWFDDDHHQDILYSEDAADAIRNGANPIDDGWEDGNGYQVCIANSVEASETAYVVLDMMTDATHEWSSDLYDTVEDAIEEAEREWNHLTDSEKKKRHIIAGKVARDYKSENPVDDGIYEVFWDSDDKAEIEMSVYVNVNDNIYEIVAEVPRDNQDPWEVIMRHDRDYGSRLYDKLDESNITGDKADIERAVRIETEDDIDWSDEATMVISLRTEGRASIKCTVTELARRIGADVGDQVLITMKKL